MITIVLEQGESVVSTCGREENERYLLGRQDSLKLLSQLSDCGYDTFGKDDMPELIGELQAVRECVGDRDRCHVDQIIALAVRCQAGNGMTLTFTPFGE
ncbi:hypothetical protein [Planctellipticum variicoloris]|uniref:hypothetical protein n=1 Tax=Planctellipticum variicoloris TaxID=3064265 RepID=UPI003013EFE8|nr:hypothetical protein SH412_001057 [Planctomycetaceae bacterium SH412]